MPIIILEGIDGSGKSTLSDRIASKAQSMGIKTKQVHRGPLEGTVIDELIKPLFEVADDELLICDRWHVGEVIYGPIYRGESKVLADIDTIEGLLDMLNAVRVVVTAPLNVIQDRLETRGEDYLKPEHVKTVWNAYMDWTGEYGYLIVDTSQFADVDLLVEALILNATSHRQAA